MEAEAETATATVATRETRIKQETIGDDPIKRMIWSLGSDNKVRYPGRVKMLFDYLGLTIAGDEDYESFRIYIQAGF